jgi:2-polyprenyl-6-hydroxyphenyl methylase/3-demethylubiquinone-9 3-methyltransferase
MFSRAALNLGAEVISFDYDPDSVATTRETLQSTDSERWHAEQGDVTDARYMSTLGEYDYVYCWGVAHHTGDLWGAFRNVCDSVAPGGKVCIGLYNHVARTNRSWNTERAIQLKKTYNRLPSPLRPLLVGLWSTLALAYRWKNQREKPWDVIRDYGGQRGMSFWHDMVDWCGGLPFEAATPQDVRSFVDQELDQFVIEREDIVSVESPTSVNTYTLRHID